jgi:putative hydrolase of the HAD superfamily
MPEPVRLVAFDLDDTLYPEAQFVAGGFEAAGRLLDGEAGLPPVAAAVFLDVLAREGPFRVLDSGLARLGIPRDDALVARLVAAYRAHAPRIGPYPGAWDLLAGLREAGVRTAVVTDGPPDVQRRKVAALGLECRIDLVAYARDVDGACHPKPDPGAFRWLERATGLGGPAIVYVGDNPARDFPPAEACGWRTVRVRFPGAFHAEDPDPDPGRAVADSMERLRDVLQGLCAP